MTDCLPTIRTPEFLSPPDDLGDGWNVASFSQVGMDPAPVLELVQLIESRNDHHIEGMLIVKNGYLVFEKYFPGYGFNWNDPGEQGPPVNYGPKTRHYMASESKTITSLLFGIAMDKGLIPSVNEKIGTYYQDDYPDIMQGQKTEITLRHLLTMSSGLAWDESPPGTNDAYNLFRASDPIRYILNLRQEYSPGTHFHYNSGGTNLLGDIIHRSSGMNLREFAREYLFTPLQITDFEWKSIRDDHIFASGGLSLIPRDLAKIGQLCLNQGEWYGRQLISKSWLTESWQSCIIPTEFGIGNGYGYQWWMNDFRNSGKNYQAWFAVGWGEQLMYVFRKEKLVILFFGSYYFHSPEIPIHSLVEDWLLGSLTCKALTVSDLN
ncbi:MAG: serine hydrolase [Bacteroidota bacterium]